MSTINNNNVIIPFHSLGHTICVSSELARVSQISKIKFRLFYLENLNLQILKRGQRGIMCCMNLPIKSHGM